MKVLLVLHRRSVPSAELAMEQAIITELPADTHYVEDSWKLPDLRGYDAVVVFVRFSELNAHETLQWGGFSGLRVLLDHDSFQDYGGWPGSPYVGAWSRSFRRHEFDLIVTSGIASRDHFANLGFDADLLYKGVSEHDFHPLGQPRSGLSMYGSPYPARLKTVRTARRHGIDMDWVRAPYTELNAKLNAYLGVIVCNLAAVPTGGVMGEFVNRYRPGTFTRLSGAPEPMFKNFESSAAGLAVFTDYTTDLEPLGFVDGQSAIVYHTLDELIERLRYWSNDPDRMRAIGEAGSRLTLSRHTWSVRVVELRELLSLRVAT